MIKNKRMGKNEKGEKIIRNMKKDNWKFYEKISEK